MELHHKLQRQPTRRVAQKPGYFFPDPTFTVDWRRKATERLRFQFHQKPTKGELAHKSLSQNESESSLSFMVPFMLEKKKKYQAIDHKCTQRF